METSKFKTFSTSLILFYLMIGLAAPIASAGEQKFTRKFLDIYCGTLTGMVTSFISEDETETDPMTSVFIQTYESVDSNQFLSAKIETAREGLKEKTKQMNANLKNTSYNEDEDEKIKLFIINVNKIVIAGIEKQMNTLSSLVEDQFGRVTPQGNNFDSYIWNSVVMDYSLKFGEQTLSGSESGN